MGIQIAYNVFLPSDHEDIPVFTRHTAPYTVEGEPELVEIDTVFYVSDQDPEEVRRSLIDHDFYPDDINVEEFK